MAIHFSLLIVIINYVCIIKLFFFKKNENGFERYSQLRYSTSEQSAISYEMLFPLYISSTANLMLLSYLVLLIFNCLNNSFT